MASTQDFMTDIRDFLTKVCKNVTKTIRIPDYIITRMYPYCKKYEEHTWLSKDVRNYDKIEVSFAFISSESQPFSIIDISTLIPCNKLYLVIAELEKFYNYTDMRISLAVDMVYVYGLENLYIYGIRKQFDICIEYLCRNGYFRSKFDEHIKIMFLIGTKNHKSPLNILRTNFIADPNMTKIIFDFL
jgi:hypothetical protein